MLRPLAALLVLVALGVMPATALAQSAGDDQYSDPFQGEPAPSEQPQAEPEPDQPPAAAPTAPAEGGNGTAEAAPTASAPALPRTGLPVHALLVAGIALLGSGAALRRRC